KPRVPLQPAADDGDAAHCVVQARGAVLGFAQDGRITAVKERVRHGRRRLANAADDHFRRDGVERQWRASVMTRLPKSSTVNIWPASTTVVESYCSMIAGPLMQSPLRRRARSNTPASTNRVVAKS